MKQSIPVQVKVVNSIEVQLQVGQKKFACDLKKCKGACCVKGFTGAPLMPQDISAIKKYWGVIKKYITPEGKKIIEENGFFVKDERVIEEIVAPTLNVKTMDGPCAYSVNKGGITFCGIESAYRAGKIPFQKPIACHLYPFKVDPETGVLNLDYWDVCKPGYKNGRKLNIKAIDFMKDPLNRLFGGKRWEFVKNLKHKKYKITSVK